MLLLLFTGGIWLYIAFNPELSYYGYGGGDNVAHYLISRYAFSHPCLFFHHWGKPVFTMLSAPFAQFGIKGIYVFNIVVSLSSAFLAGKIAKKSGVQFPIIAILLTAFAPVFFFTASTSLTEPLFALLLIAGIYFIISERYIFSAIILSCMIFIRTESIILLPLLLIVYAILRSWKAIPFLFTGFLVFSLAGMSCHDGFLWFFSNSPYSADASLYGNGTLFAFLKEYREIFGKPGAILLLTGFIYVIFTFFQKPFPDRKKTALYLLLFGSVFLFFAAHSWVWYKGIGNSLGLIRVMACVIPPAAVIGALGFEGVIKYIVQPISKIQYALVGTIGIYVIISTLRIYPSIVHKSGPDEVLLRQTAEWVSQSEYKDQKVLYFNPLIPFMLNQDPWSQEKAVSLVQNKVDFNTEMMPGDIILWDAHFGPNEGGIQSDSLMKSPSLKLIMMFTPEFPFTVLGGYNYEILIFQKLPEGETADNYNIIENNSTFLKSKYTQQILFEQLFLQSDSLPYAETDLNDNTFLSAGHSFEMRSGFEFFTVLEKQFTEIYDESAKYLLFETGIYFTDSTGLEALLVFSIEQNGEVLQYEAKPIEFKNHTAGKWENAHIVLQMNAPIDEQSIFKCYIWNRSKTGSFLIDDCRLIYLK